MTEPKKTETAHSPAMFEGNERLREEIREEVRKEVREEVTKEVQEAEKKLHQELEHELEEKLIRQPENEDLKVDVGSEESMDASDPTAASQPGQKDEPVPSSGFPE